MSRADQSLSRQKPKMCSAALAIGTGFAERGRRADIEAELELVVEIARRTDSSAPFRSRALRWPARPPHRRAADAHRRGAAVIGDRHVFVVRQQRIVGPERAAGIGGVEDRGEEVGEVADPHRQQQVRPAPSASRCRRRLLLAMRRRSAARDKASRKADQACGPSAISGLRCGAAHAARPPRRAPANDATPRGDVEDLVADRDADARDRARRRPKHAERQVLDREIAVRARSRSRQSFGARDRVSRSAGLSFDQPRQDRPLRGYRGSGLRCAAVELQLAPALISLSRRLPSASMMRASSG